MPDETRTNLFLLMTQIYIERDQTFGNGRTARDVFEAIQERMDNRLADTEMTREQLTTVLPEDIPEAAKVRSSTRPNPQAPRDEGRTGDVPTERKRKRRPKRAQAAEQPIDAGKSKRQ